VALLTRDRPGATFKDDCLRSSLVRCATGDFDPCTDSGIIKTMTRILPHASSMESARIPERADEFSFPLVGWQSEALAKKDETLEPPLKLQGAGIRISAFKAAENGQGFMLRAFESLGKASTAKLTLGGSLRKSSVFEANLLEDEERKLAHRNGGLKLAFSPFEIKTLVFKTGGRIFGSRRQPQKDVFSCNGSLP